MINKKYKNTNAITLIALVVTIIVLLILAGISISMLTGQNGILNRATQSKEQTTVATEQEAISIAYSGSLINTQGERVKNAHLKEELTNMGYNVNVTGGATKKVTFNDSGNIYKVGKNGTITDYEPVDTTKVYAFLCDENSDGKGETLVLSSTPTINKAYVKEYGENQAFQANGWGAYVRPGGVEFPYGPPVWYEDCVLIKKVVIYDEIAPDVTYGWFADCEMLEKIEKIKYLNTSNVTNMASMFGGCSSLTNLDVTEFDTSNVTTMVAMFSDCSSLTNLDVTEFDTSNVTNMMDMFMYCEMLQNIKGIENFNTSNVTSMYRMFSNCYKLQNLVLSKWDTSSVGKMDMMFLSCESLSKLNLSGWETPKLYNMMQMFEDCISLTQIDLSTFDTTNVGSYSGLFNNVTADVYIGDKWNDKMNESRTDYKKTFIVK